LYDLLLIGAIVVTIGIVDELEVIVDEPEGIVDELEGIVDELEGIVGELEGIVDELEGIVDELEDIVDEPEGIVELEGIVDEPEDIMVVLEGFMVELADIPSVGWALVKVASCSELRVVPVEMAKFSITASRADTRVSTAEANFSFLFLRAVFSSSEQLTCPAPDILLAVSLTFLLAGFWLMSLERVSAREEKMAQVRLDLRNA